MSETVVVNLVGDAGHGRLAESRLVEVPFAYGGVRDCVALAFAVAQTGRDVELRGWIPRVIYDELAETVEARPQVELEARAPERDDVVVLPDGWRDPLEFAQLALSPADVWIFLMGPPGLVGWPFTDEPWSLPDPLTVDIERLARPEHFQGMQALGLRLLTPSEGLSAASGAAGVACRNVGTGWPVEFPLPGHTRKADVAGLMENRWAPLVERVLDDLGDGVEADCIPPVDNAEVLRRFGRARILVWPSRVEGRARITAEARAMGCVPVALDTNRFAAGLREEDGVVTVGSLQEMAPAIRSLLDDAVRLDALSNRGRSWARRHEEWEPFVDRARGWLLESGPRAEGKGALASSGESFRAAMHREQDENEALRYELSLAKEQLTKSTGNEEYLAHAAETLRGGRFAELARRIERRMDRR